jgi:polyhydroxyalkanoate synthesis regulator phasin
MLEAFEHQEQEIRKDMTEKLETEMQSLRDEITILKKRLPACEAD